MNQRDLSERLLLIDNNEFIRAYETLQEICEKFKGSGIRRQYSPLLNEHEQRYKNLTKQKSSSQAL